LLASAEMTRHAVVQRAIPGALPAECNVTAAQLRDPKFIMKSNWGLVLEAAGKINGLPFYVSDADEMNVNELAAMARLHVRRYGVQLVIVDYLQVLNTKGRDFREQVTNASNVLRKLAKQEQVAVVALSQLSRPRDGNENDRPSMISLKESGSLEAHAHAVLLLYRPKDSDNRFTGEDELVIGKQREGLTGWEPITLDERKLTFRERGR